MGKIGKALGYGSMPGLGGSEPDDDADDTDSEDAPKGSSAEVLAMKAFTKAVTPEDKAEALKDFLSACGVYGS
jgi:hypothetical protein